MSWPSSGSVGWPLPNRRMALTPGKGGISPYTDLHVKPYAERHVKVYADTRPCARERRPATGAEAGAPTDRSRMRMALMPPHHPEWQPGRHLIAAEGGAGRRHAKIADATNHKIARSAPYGAAAPLPLGGPDQQQHRQAGMGDPRHLRRGECQGECQGGCQGGSRHPKRSKLSTSRQAAELASEAARAEGASITGECSRRRWAGSGISATTLWAAGVDLVSAADQGEQAGPLLGMGSDEQAHGGSASPARQP
jgi:hypothetical protein